MLVTQARYVAPDISGVSKSRVKMLILYRGQKQPDDFNNIFETKKKIQKVFGGDMLIRTLPTIPLQ